MPAWKLFAIIVPVVFVIDMLWLGVVMKDFYARELGDLARKQGAALSPRWSAVILVYVLIPAGLVLFARAAPGTEETVWRAVARAAVYGFILYGVYDLTNLAVLEKWTVRMTCVDITWGTVLCGLVGGLMHWLGNRGS